MPTNIDGFTVFGAIEQKWLSIGGPNSPLKHPVTNEFKTFDGVGRRQNFQGGMISWRPNTGAFVVWGLIGERWLQIGAEQFGYPITDESVTGDRKGRFNHFRAFRADNSLIGESTIIWQPQTGAHQIYGAIRDFWAKNGWERSQVGYPVNAEEDRSDQAGRSQLFQRGRILWTSSNGAYYARPTITNTDPIKDNGYFVEVRGVDFTPYLGVTLNYRFTAAVRHEGDPVNTTSGTEVAVCDKAGRFVHRLPVTFGDNLHGGHVDAIDVATNVATSKDF